MTYKLYHDLKRLFCTEYSEFLDIISKSMYAYVQNNYNWELRNMLFDYFCPGPVFWNRYAGHQVLQNFSSSIRWKSSFVLRDKPCSLIYSECAKHTAPPQLSLLVYSWESVWMSNSISFKKCKKKILPTRNMIGSIVWKGHFCRNSQLQIINLKKGNA